MGEAGSSGPDPGFAVPETLMVSRGARLTVSKPLDINCRLKKIDKRMAKLAAPPGWIPKSGHLLLKRCRLCFQCFAKLEPGGLQVIQHRFALTVTSGQFAYF